MENNNEKANGQCSYARDRDVRSDELKAAAIIGVVCIHAELPYNEIWRFCVPVFIALWAFHYEQGLARQENYWRYARHRFYRLSVPYLFWTGVYLLLLHPLDDWTTVPIHTILGGWFGGYGWAGQYFFIILFQLTWLFPLIRQMVTRQTVWPVVILSSLLNAWAGHLWPDNSVVAAIGIRPFIYWIPYVFLGAALARGFPHASKTYLLGAFALLAAPLDPKSDHMSPYLLPTVIVGSIAMLLALGPRGHNNQLWSPPENFLFWEWFRYIGRNSLPIFVCSPLFLLAVHEVWSPPDPFSLPLIGRALVIVAAIAGSLAVAWALRKLGLGIVVGG